MKPPASPRSVGADGLVHGLGGRRYRQNDVAARVLREARGFRVFERPAEQLQRFLVSRAVGMPIDDLVAQRLPEK